MFQNLTDKLLVLQARHSLLNWFNDDDAHSAWGERPDNKEDKEGKGHLNSEVFFEEKKCNFKNYTECAPGI